MTELELRAGINKDLQFLDDKIEAKAKALESRVSKLEVAIQNIIKILEILGTNRI